ncbi:MAG: helix-turn-helix transcriptional regulator [Verrucomicrobiia bacterium]|jgi:transcriptional regulator with XRE-family HTH domain
MAKRHPVLTAFGLNVRKQREAHGLTQESLAEKADLDQTYISGIKRGLRNPGVLSIAKIAKALGISISDVCRGIDKRKL